MKNTLAAFALISFSLAVSSNLPAQSRGAQRTQVVSSGRTDLNTALIDLERVSQATQVDIASMHVEKWKAGWKSGFLKDESHKEQAQQAAGSLQRNLRNALPDLIHDVQNSRGSMSTTFKLYDDVSLVCEAVDSLINASEAAGKKDEAAQLVDDYSALTRVRRSLSTYIQQASASWENRGKAPYAAVSAPPMQTAQPAPRMASSSVPRTAPPSSTIQIVNDQGVKKIIVDDTIPEKKPAPAAKKKPETFSNL
jgi:hypothetical protein